MCKINILLGIHFPIPMMQIRKRERLNLKVISLLTSIMCGCAYSLYYK